VNTATVAPSKASRITWAVIATAVAGISIYLLWWLAIPRTHACEGIIPAPAGCTSTNRFGIAAIWTAIIVAAYVGVLASLAARVRLWVRLLLTALLVGSAVWAYYSTLNATPLGFGA
jgi:xanthine/uracil permease